MILALSLLACGPDKDANNPGSDSGCLALLAYADADADGFGDLGSPIEACEIPSGYVQDATDCDDADPAVNPGAVEVCNGLDDDCDALVDDDDDSLDTSTWSTFYADADADAYGDPAAPVYACELPDGAAENDFDCDDDEPDVNPGAVEVCNDIDDDCDGEIDEDDASDASTWNADEDGDGYGDSERTTVACAQPSNTVDNSDDCDDTDADAHPDALEYCDGHDDDCDGQVDEDDAEDAQDWYADTDADTYGDPDAGTTACDQPSGYVADATDCDDADEDTNPGELEYCDGHDDDCDGDVDEADAEDTSTWHPDADADSYGNPDRSLQACDQPSGYVADNTDCDDGDDAIHPGAAEICNDVDDDCDATTSHDGMVSFIDSSGVTTDVTSSFSGAVVLSSDGTLEVCDGTFLVNLDVQADVTIQSQSGDATAVVLDGDASGSVIGTSTAGLDITVQDLTLTGGSGTVESTIYSGNEVGGGVYCFSSGATTDVALVNVVIDGNEADYGGGLALSGCDLTASDLLVSDNEAVAGAALWVLDGDHQVDDSELSDNVASLSAVVAYGYTEYPQLTFDDVLLDANDSNTAAAVYAYLADLFWTGTASTASGITNHTSGVSSSTGLDEDGAIFLYGSTLDADTVDFGTSAGGDQNEPIDVWVDDASAEYAAGDDASFECDLSGCGTASDASVGGTASTSSLNSRWYLAIVEPDETATLNTFGAEMDSDGTCTEVQLIVAEAATAAATDFEVVWVETVSLAGAGPITSSDIGIALDPDHAWGIGYEMFCDDGYLTLYYDTSTGSSDAGLGASTRFLWGSSDPGELSVGDTISGTNQTAYGTPAVNLDLDYTTL